jgi:DNA-binding CsgD family transcriptional regulator
MPFRAAAGNPPGEDLPHEEPAALRALAAGCAEASLVALDLLPFGVILLDESGQVAAANAAAEAMLRARAGLVRAERGLRAEGSAAARAELEQAITGCCVARTRSVAVVRCPRTPPASALHVVVAPVVRALPVRRPRQKQAAAVILVSDPDVAPAPDPETLRRLFGLTPALGRLAAAVAAGATVSEYASAHGVTRGTARNQLKELMARTQTRRQADLVRVLLTGVSILRVGNPGEGSS